MDLNNIERGRGMTVQQLTSRFNSQNEATTAAAKPPPPRTGNGYKRPVRPPPRNAKRTTDIYGYGNRNNNNNNNNQGSGISGIGISSMHKSHNSHDDVYNNDSKSNNNSQNNSPHKHSNRPPPSAAQALASMAKMGTQSNNNNDDSRVNGPPLSLYNGTKSLGNGSGSRPINPLNKRTNPMAGNYSNKNNLNTISSDNGQRRRTSSLDRINDGNNPLPPPKVPHTYVNLKNGSSNNNSPKNGHRPRIKSRHSLTLNRSIGDNYYNNNGRKKTELVYDPAGLGINNRTKNFKASFDDIKVNNLENCETEALMAQMNDGTECLRFFSEALATFASQQKKQANSMLKLFDKSKKRYAQMDGMPNFTFTMELVHQLLEETVKRESEFAAFLDDTCVPMINKLEKDCEREWQRIHNKSKKELKTIQSSRNNLIKIQKSTKNAVSNVQKQRINLQENSNNYNNLNNSNIHDSSKGANFKKLINNVQSKTHVGGQNGNLLDNSYDKAKKLDKQLKTTMVLYSKSRNEYINSQNRNKQDVVNMEHYRVSTMLQVFRQMANKQETILNNRTIVELQEDILVKTSQMDSILEIQKFVKECIEKHGKWEPPVPPITSFPVNTPEYEYRDMFYSVDDALSLTRDLDKNAKIPIVISLLCDKVEKLNGFKTEGIFRISALKSDVKQLKIEFQTYSVLDYNKIDFTTKSRENVHLYASLLKDWLRGLSDSVIPQRYYDYCIDMAKNKKLDKEHFNVFFSQIPENNREIVKYITNFIKRIISPQNVEATKMNVDNLAVVFGPNLLRCPSDDPTILMQNNLFEKEFFVSLITVTD